MDGIITVEFSTILKQNEMVMCLHVLKQTITSTAPYILHDQAGKMCLQVNPETVAVSFYKFDSTKGKGARGWGRKGN